MKLTQWWKGLVNGVLGRKTVDPELERIKLAWERERKWVSDQLKEYASATRRLTHLSDTVTGETAEHLEWYKQALKEPTVKAGMLTKIYSVAQLDLTVKASDRNPAAEEIADFNRDNVTRSKGGMRHVIESLLFGALTYGFSVCHKKKKTAERGKWAGKIVLDQLKSKDTSDGKIQLEVDQFKNVTGIRAIVNNERQVFDPKEFVVFTFLGFFQNPLGMSDLRAVYRASKMKHEALNLRMIYLDKFSGPYLVGKYSDPSVKASLETALEQARGMSYLTVDVASAVEVIDLATKGTADFKAAIDDLDREILMGITFSSLPHLEGMTPSGRGDTKVQQGTAQLGVWYLAELVSDALNDQIIPDFTDDNYPGKPELPMASLGGVDPATTTAELNNAKILHDMGGDLDMDELYERAGWSVPAEDARVLAGLVAAPPPAPGGFGFEDTQPTAPAAGGGEPVNRAAPFASNGRGGR